MFFFDDDKTRVEVERSESIVATENKYCNYTGSPAVPFHNKGFHMVCNGNMFQFSITIDGGILVTNDVIFVMKSAYRPATRIVFPIIEANNKRIAGVCQVLESGECRVAFDNGQPRDVIISGNFVLKR